ncbi:hypothetical protein J2799_000626 [Chryseobacterium vietnamense]|nr:hypothetical protein [Chryseobacterium vietnamense]
MKQPINKEFIKNRYDTTIDNFSNQAFQVNGIEIFLILPF